MYNMNASTLSVKQAINDMLDFAFHYRSERIGRSLILHADCFEWLAHCAANSFHAVITDPPFGVKEFTRTEIEKLNNGHGGVWRIPPKIGGSQRA